MSYAIDTGAINLGACKIWYEDTNGWVSIGATSGGLTFNYNPSLFDMKIDQTGETIVKKILQGEDATIKFGIAESGLEKLQLAIPFGTIYASGADKAFGVGVNMGGDMLDHTVKLKVHPQNTRGTGGIDDESYINYDFTIWMAGNTSAVELNYSHDAARVYDVTMNIFPEFSQNSGRYLFVIGDPSVSADGIAPDINTLGVYPADGATAVVITIEPRIVMSEVIRELSSGVPNAIAKLVKESDHSNVTIAVASEQYVEGTAQSGTGTTIVLASGEIDGDDQYNGLSIQITDGAGKGDDLVAITDSVATGDTLTVAAWPNGTPDITSKYKIYATRITITPSASLDASTLYNILLANAKDLAGNIQTNIFESDFTTAV